MNMMVRNSIAVAAAPSQRRLLDELMRDEIIPAVIKFNENTRDRMWVGKDDSIATIQAQLPYVETYALWPFADRVAVVSVPQMASHATSVLGVTKDMFWCVVLHYALWQGLRDYKAVHKGLGPEDFEAYLYAMLTCDNPGEEIRKDF